MKVNYLIMWLLLGSWLTFSGCKEDDIIVNTDIEGDGRLREIGIPGINFTYSLADVLRDVDEDMVKVDEDGLIYLSYTQEVLLDWEDMVQLIDNFWSHEPSVVDGAPALKSSPEIEFEQKVKFNHRDDVRYDSLVMDSGVMFLELNVPPGSIGTVTITIEIPEVFDNGVPLKIVRPIDVTLAQTTYSLSFPLQGYFIRFSQEPEMSFVTVNTSMGIDSSNPELLVSGVNLDMSMTDMKPEIVFGYFGQQQSSSYDTELVFDVFDELEIIEGIEFGGASMELITYNRIGVPFNVKVENIRFFKEMESTEPDWQLIVDENDFVELEVTSALYGNPVQPGEGRVSIDQGNSNILEINRYPVRLLCDILGFSNPGNPQGNFLAYDFQLKNDLTINLPLWFKADSYSRKDTIEFDFNDMVGDSRDDIGKIGAISIILDFYSTLPITVQASLLVVDENNEVIDDLMPGLANLIQAGVPGSSGKVETPVHTKFTVSINGEQLVNFSDKNAMNLVLETKANTHDYQNTYVKIYEDAKLKSHVSIKGNARLP
jgi:hypothetical protein